MDRRKKDMRFIKTENAILQSFLTLFKENSIDDISVSNIINLANINRSTFYGHYEDKYDLLNKAEMKLILELKSLLNQSPIAEIINKKHIDEVALKTYFSKIVDFLYDNSEALNLFTTYENSSFILKFNKVIESVFIELNVTPKLSVPINYTSVSLAWLTTGLINEWIKNDFKESKESFAEILLNVAINMQKAFFMT